MLGRGPERHPSFVKDSQLSCRVLVDTRLIRLDLLPDPSNSRHGSTKVILQKVVQVERKAISKSGPAVGQTTASRNRSADMKEGYRRPSAQRWRRKKRKGRVGWRREIPRIRIARRACRRLILGLSPPLRFGDGYRGRGETTLGLAPRAGTGTVGESSCVRGRWDLVSDVSGLMLGAARSRSTFC